MSWTVWYSPLDTTLTQPFTPSANSLLSILRIDLVRVGGPSATGLTLSVKSESGALIDQETRDPDDFVTQDHGVYSIYFDFGFRSWLRRKQTYILELSASGYSFATGSHYGWVKDWPDPMFDFEATVANLGSSPHRCAMFAQRFVKA